MELDDDEVVIGKECHIVAQRPDGPRAPATLTEPEVERWSALIGSRDGYANLVLMCGTHHDVIDGDVKAYPVERLVTIKTEHELAIEKALSEDDRHAENLDVRYAGIIETWSERIKLDSWDGAMSDIVVNGAIQSEVLDELHQTRMWLLTRVWPRTRPRLEAALGNFSAVSQDLEMVVRRYSTDHHGRILIDRVHKEVPYDPTNTPFLERRGEYMRELAADLTIELTRAANLVCDRVREGLWPTYRLEEGYSTIGLGLDMNLTYSTLLPLYPANTPEIAYPGLNRFVEERATSDCAIGEGRPFQGFAVPGVAGEDDDL